MYGDEASWIMYYAINTTGQKSYRTEPSTKTCQQRVLILWTSQSRVHCNALEGWRDSTGGQQGTFKNKQSTDMKNAHSCLPPSCH